MAISGIDPSNVERDVAVDVEGRVFTGTSYEITAPAAQASTNDPALLVGSQIDARDWLTVSYTVVNAAQTIIWWVYGANSASYADKVIVKGPSDVLASATDSYAVSPAPYAYYCVWIDSKVDAAFGTVTCVGITKK
jgi:hypothetical protein